MLLADAGFSMNRMPCLTPHTNIPLSPYLFSTTFTHIQVEMLVKMCVLVWCGRGEKVQPVL